MPEARWGFCSGCARWRYSDEWLTTTASRPSCPVCGTEPSPLEELEDGKGRIVLMVELPPGTDFPLLP